MYLHFYKKNSNLITVIKVSLLIKYYYKKDNEDITQLTGCQSRLIP